MKNWKRPDSKRLAFNQVGREGPASDVLTREKIKSLAVPELHAAAHTAQLFNMRIVEEPTKTFAARV